MRGSRRYITLEIIRCRGKRAQIIGWTAAPAGRGSEARGSLLDLDTASRKAIEQAVDKIFKRHNRLQRQAWAKRRCGDYDELRRSIHGLFGLNEAERTRKKVGK